ncbi:MAG TPA: hypothetical protein VFQ42_04285 [Mycobacterium sp.]|nr:hypothetical protein [Mycobacterium sp.]
MTKPDPETDALASAVLLVNQKVAERTGRDLAAENLTPAQQAEVLAAAKRARGK